MMGEAPKLAMAESHEVSARAIAPCRKQARDRGGARRPGLAAIGELGKASMDLGAAGIMVAPPSTLKTDSQIVVVLSRCRAGLGATVVPIVLQDFPLATNVHVAPEVIGQIVADIPEMVMLKHEDCRAWRKSPQSEWRKAEDQRRISILCGNGASVPA